MSRPRTASASRPGCLAWREKWALTGEVKTSGWPTVSGLSTFVSGRYARAPTEWFRFSNRPSNTRGAVMACGRYTGKQLPLMAKQCLTFAQLPEDEAAFLEFLATTGDVWLRGCGDTARKPKFPPLPAAEFLHRYTPQLSSDGCLGVYLGFERDILRPPSFSLRFTENGKRQSTNRVDDQLVLLVAYHRGGIMKSGLLCLSSIGYRTHTTKKPKEVLSWARRVVGWWEKRASVPVPLSNSPDLGHGTPAAKAASLRGLKIA